VACACAHAFICLRERSGERESGRELERVGKRTCLCVRERELACMYVRECACLCGWRISVCRSPPGSLRKQLSSSVRLLIVILPRMCKELFFVLRSIRQKWVWTSIPRNRRRWRNICSCCWTLHHPRRYAAAHDITAVKQRQRVRGITREAVRQCKLLRVRG